MADTLKFGPEWLRALSDGNSVGTPPPSPGFGKYKLAEYRYGREEMLALFNSKSEIPEELKPMTSILVDKVQDPLALVCLSDEEQRIMSQSVNSMAVLRMFGRGGPPGVRGGRGGSTDRGRGRGRGRGDGFVQRGTSYEESGGGFGRPPNQNRADGWEEVGAKRNYQNRYEDGSGVIRPGFQRSLSSDNWRDREAGEDDGGDGDWRKAGSKIGSRSNWRDPATRGGFDPDRNRQNGLQRGGFDRDKGRRTRTSESWDDDDNLPEWSMPDDDNVEEVGTFDSSGAFVSTKTKPETPVTAETPSSENLSPPEPPEIETKEKEKAEKIKPETQKKNKVETEKKKVEEKPKEMEEKALPQREQKMKDKVKQKQQASKDSTVINNSDRNNVQIKKSTSAEKTVTSKPNEKESKSENKKSTPEKDSAKSVKLKVNNSAENVDITTSKSASKKVSEQEALDRLKEAAENMVLAAMTAEDEEKEREKTDPNNIIYPQDHENALKWFYKDPQGDMQGPFLASEMAEWFSAGYFTMNLLVKRGSDERFSPLGELIKRWGRVPFLPGPSPPPLLNNPESQAGPDAAQQQQEQLKVLQQQFMLQQQIMQQQLLMRHLQMQQINQVMQQLQENEQFKSLSIQHQQQIAMQLLLKQSQSTAIPSSTDPQKLSPRSSAEAVPGSNTPPLPSDHPSFHRSMSQPTNLSHTPPEDASIWGSINPPMGAGAWSQPTSVWDLGQGSGTSPDVEKQLERELKEAEKRKREIELEEKRKQEELMKHEEALRKQQEEIQQQKEEMERQRKELERQRQLELQKIEEARKQQEEELRIRQEHEQRMRKIEEEKRRKEEEIRRKKAEEELKRKQEEELRIRQEEEIRRKLEDELRQQEMKKQEELRRQELHRQKELEETEKQKQIEMQKSREMQKQQEIQKQQQEAVRKLQQEQLANIQLPSHVQWAKQQTAAVSNGQQAKSLVEIQQQEEREHRIKQEVQRQQELQKQQMLALQQQQQQQKSWSSQIMSTPASNSAKSLLEIQEEQARQLHEKMKNTQQQQPQVKNMTIGTASVWGGVSSSSSHWASEGAWGNVLKAQTSNTSNGGGGGVNSLGFYDEAIISSKRADPPPTNKSSRQGSTAEFPALKVKQSKSVSSMSSNKATKSGKSKKEEEAVQRLFQSNRTEDDFTLWCEKVLKNMATSVDIPTFVAFLKEVESPYEVHDYVRSYLGESKAANDFSKQFLEKRSQSKQKAKQDQHHEDSIWGPAPARDFHQVNNQTSESEAQRKSAGKKKKKMMKVDSSILGFTVHAAPDRVNVGEIDVQPIEGPK